MRKFLVRKRDDLPVVDIPKPNGCENRKDPTIVHEVYQSYLGHQTKPIAGIPFEVDTAYQDTVRANL